jgi:threonine synthase
MSAHPGVLERYARMLPIGEHTPPLSLQEGSTPLLHAPRLAEWVGVDDLYLKIEGANPTGSFKDRGMVVAVAKAVEAGAPMILCASTGNTAASAAAYAARAGILAVVLLPRDSVAINKVAQAVAYGARVLIIDANFDGALTVARSLAQEYGVALVNSVNPHRIAGQATAAYEICEVLGDAPSVLALPVGNGGNITAYWQGFRTFREQGRVAHVPRMLGVQAAGAAPFVGGTPVDRPQTIASAIRIGRPATWLPAIDAAHDSRGGFRAVSDEQILEAHGEISRREGVFCEPSSAASVAGLRTTVLEGGFEPDGACVCVLTGNGLKDPGAGVDPDLQPAELPADIDAVARHLQLDAALAVR